MSIFNDEIDKETVVFGGGCFWCTEAIFKMLKGVVSAEPGYAGGAKEHPTHEEVSSGETGHAEVVKIRYYPEKISFKKLLEVFFSSHDASTINAQGADKGSQYRSIILYTTSEQKKTAKKFIEKLNSSSHMGNNIITEIRALEQFFPAQDRHKDYYKNHTNTPYCKVVINKKLEDVKNKFGKLIDKKSITEVGWDRLMTANQYNVMVEKKTEPPFTGKYVHETKDGIYVCSVCGNPLFSSDAKFDSGTGWPSFDRTVPEAVGEIEGGTTAEIVCAKCGSHLGHVFNDGPTETQKRYCINSVCLNLKSKKQGK